MQASYNPTGKPQYLLIFGMAFLYTPVSITVVMPTGKWHSGVIKRWEISVEWSTCGRQPISKQSTAGVNWLSDSTHLYSVPGRLESCNNAPKPHIQDSQVCSRQFTRIPCHEGHFYHFPDIQGHWYHYNCMQEESGDATQVQTCHGGWRKALMQWRSIRFPNGWVKWRVPKAPTASLQFDIMGTYQLRVHLSSPNAAI